MTATCWNRPASSTRASARPKPALEGIKVLTKTTPATTVQVAHPRSPRAANRRANTQQAARPAPTSNGPQVEPSGGRKARHRLTAKASVRRPETRKLAICVQPQSPRASELASPRLIRSCTRHSNVPQGTDDSVYSAYLYGIRENRRAD